MRIKTSKEDYLERILMISNSNRKVKSIDIATELGFSRASVSVAMKQLRQEGHISIDENGYITLLPSGEKIACNVLKRHNILTKLLIDLGVNEKIAEEDACKIEHCISQESFEAIENYYKSNKK